MELQEQIKKIQQNKALVQQLMTSPDGQRLLAMLTKDGGGQLNQAAAAAAKGNTADIVHMLAKVMQSEEGAKLVHKINDQINWPRCSPRKTRLKFPPTKKHRRRLRHLHSSPRRRAAEVRYRISLRCWAGWI